MLIDPSDGHLRCGEVFTLRNLLHSINHFGVLLENLGLEARKHAAHIFGKIIDCAVFACEPAASDGTICKHGNGHCAMSAFAI